MCCCLFVVIGLDTCWSGLCVSLVKYPPPPLFLEHKEHTQILRNPLPILLPIARVTVVVSVNAYHVTIMISVNVDHVTIMICVNAYHVTIVVRVNVHYACQQKPFEY